MPYNPQLYQANVGNYGYNYPNVLGTQTAPLNNSYNQTPNIGYPPMNIQSLPTAAYVQSDIEASSYPVGAGNTVVLMDSNSIDTENPIVYIKSTGFDGKPLRFKKITGTTIYPNEQGLFSNPQVENSIPQIDLSEYARSSDLDGLKSEVSGIVERLDVLDKNLVNVNDSISSIDNRFSNMFNAVTGNNNNNNSNNNSNNSNNSNSNKNNHNNGNNRKGNNQ